MQKVDEIRLTACAKINLNLGIVGKRSDGYHLLYSLFCFTEFGDEIVIKNLASLQQTDNSLSLKIEGEFGKNLACDDSNSVVKAAKGLAKLIGIVPAAEITIVKNLPVAAGIGGGTSDAAAAINGLLRLWGKESEVKREDIERLALDIGADVPPSLDFKSVVVEGIGEVLSPAPKMPDNISVLLINPNKVVPTKEIFRLRKGEFSLPFVFKTEYENIYSLCEDLKKTNNDLKKPALELCPDIGDVLMAIEESGALFSQMSGSGATCFGLYPDEEKAREAACSIRQVHPEWWVKNTRIRDI